MLSEFNLKSPHKVMLVGTPKQEAEELQRQELLLLQEKERQRLIEEEQIRQLQEEEQRRQIEQEVRYHLLFEHDVDAEDTRRRGTSTKTRR